MARRGDAKATTRAPAALSGAPTQPPREDSDLCLECGLCCDGTLFGAIVVHIPEREFVESLGLPVHDDPAGGIVAPLPCSAFVDGCCALYEVGRPMTCGSYRCSVVTEYTAGDVGHADSLTVIGRVRSIARRLEVAMGLPAGDFTMTAVARYLSEHRPWDAPERYEQFLVAFRRFELLARTSFAYSPTADEERAAAAGERLAVHRGS